MSAPPTTLISGREFARRDGCSEKLVRRAIERGELVLISGKLDAALVKTGWREGNRKEGAPAAVSAPLSALSAPPTEAADLDKLIALNGGMLPRADADRRKANYDALLREFEYDTKSGAVGLATGRYVVL